MPTHAARVGLPVSTETVSKHGAGVVTEDTRLIVSQSNTQYSANSILEARPVEVHDPIQEEDEDTGSDAVEPVTPTNEFQAYPFHHHQQENELQPPPSNIATINKSLVVDTAVVPPTTPKTASSIQRKTSRDQPMSAPVSPQTARPTISRTSSRLRTFFRRTTSNSHEDHAPRPLPPTSVPDTSSRKWPISKSANQTPQTSAANTPPTPGSPTSTVNSSNDRLPAAPHLVDPFGKVQVRASTGLTFREKPKVMFSADAGSARLDQKRRSNSVTDLHDDSQHHPDISIPAQAGSGLKARRLSTSLPDNFYVDTCELYDEFTNASKLPGRIKHIGSGATATVKIMVRKGDSSGCQLAVKEFRKRSQKEDVYEYEQKVKSEFTIANSLQHINIVRSTRLCTHSGRWNHVMEFCQQGDVYSLMDQKYLKHEDHTCFFKQLLQGVAYLHEHGIAHRDIKLENLLLNNEGYIKITDFGVSEVFCGLHPGLRDGAEHSEKQTGECRKCSPGICGSLPYIAPEVLAKNGDYDPRPLDVWSCAIVLLTMWHGGNPWPAAERKYSFYDNFASGWDKFFEMHPDGLVAEDAQPKAGKLISTLPQSGMKRLLLQMLHPDPDKRISIQKAAKDRWVKSIDCCCVDESEAINNAQLDATSMASCKLATKMTIKKHHNHLPPEKRRLPQHRFDMGSGYS